MGCTDPPPPKGGRRTPSVFSSEHKIEVDGGGVVTYLCMSHRHDRNHRHDRHDRNHHSKKYLPPPISIENCSSALKRDGAREARYLVNNVTMCLTCLKQLDTAEKEDQT